MYFYKSRRLYVRLTLHFITGTSQVRARVFETFFIDIHSANCLFLCSQPKLQWCPQSNLASTTRNVWFVINFGLFFRYLLLLSKCLWHSPFTFRSHACICPVLCASPHPLTALDCNPHLKKPDPRYPDEKCKEKHIVWRWRGVWAKARVAAALWVRQELVS